jgi:predicted  nucleic acid-binding Zn-ribbon protein
LILRVKEQEFDIKHIFDALLYRTKLIYTTERMFAKNLSLFYLAKETQNNVEIVNTNNEMCETCRTKLTRLSYNDNLAEEKLPPHHPGCKCGVRVLVGQANEI